MSSLPACLQVSQLHFPTSPSLRVTSTPCLRAPLASLAHTQLSPHLLCAHTDLPGTCPCSYPFPCTLPCHLLASVTTRDSCLCFRLPVWCGLQAAVLLMWAIPCLALLPDTLHQGKPAKPRASSAAYDSSWLCISHTSFCPGLVSVHHLLGTQIQSWAFPLYKD